ncbi:MAG: TonB family protein [Helicobacteraceae bacterium]|nr:TonB family protein [Helicobacteraceae bacterium]
MIFKTPFSSEKKALALSLAIHTLVIGSVFYFSTQSTDVSNEPVAIPMNIMAYTPVPKEVIKPVEQAKPKPKPTPPKPKPKPEPKPEPVKEIPIEKEPIIQEPVVEEPIVEEVIEEVVQEIVEPQEPIKPQKTAEEIQKEQEEIRVQQEQEFIQTNFSVIRDMALKNLSYPRMAKKMGWSGVVEIKLVVDTNGKLLEASVVKSSGKELLDKTALKAALSLKDEVLPKPQTRSTLILPIAFNLR